MRCRRQYLPWYFPLTQVHLVRRTWLPVGELNDKLHGVAWIDLLGFGRQLEYDDLPEVVKRMESWANAFDWMPESLADVVSKPPSFELFQDTIVLWTPDDSYESMEGLFIATQYVVSALAGNGTPCRAGMAAGTLYVGNRNPNAHAGSYFILGSAIARAAAMEKDADWIGVAIHDRFADEVGEESWTDLMAKFGPSGQICEYDVPYHTKNGRETCRYWTLNWAYPVRHLVSTDILRSAWKGGVPETARSKYQNTQAYLDWWGHFFLQT